MAQHIIKTGIAAELKIRLKWNVQKQKRKESNLAKDVVNKNGTCANKKFSIKRHYLIKIKKS